MPKPRPRSSARIASQIAIGALRYFLLKFTRNSVIAFDFQEALSFEGETGPYVQYAAVRARNILRKLEEKGERLPDFRAELTREALGPPACGRRLLAGAAGRVESGCGRGARGGGGRAGARGQVRFQLAQTFNNFYHLYPIIHEENRGEESFLLWMTDFFRRQLEWTLDILGIQCRIICDRPFRPRFDVE